MSTSTALPTSTAGVNLIPQAGLVATIAMQIGWPLADGHGLAVLTILTVLTFAATCFTHAWIHRGRSWAIRYFLTTACFAFALELLGVSTGFPFSSYTYSDALGLSALGVPLLIPLAWTMAAYPALLLARTIAGRSGPNRLLVSGVGAVALTSWDLFLDPQMVSAGYWTWDSAAHALPGVPGIPAVNFLGWLVGSFVLMLLLSPLPDISGAQGVPAALWTWTWVGGIVSNAFFFGRPTVALVGGIAMGVVTVPYLVILLRDRGSIAARPPA